MKVKVALFRSRMQNWRAASSAGDVVGWGLSQARGGAAAPGHAQAPATCRNLALRLTGPGPPEREGRPKDHTDRNISDVNMVAAPLRTDSLRPEDPHRFDPRCSIRGECARDHGNQQENDGYGT